MDIGNIVTGIIGLVVAILAGVWGRAAAAISSNSRETAKLQGQLDSLQKQVQHLETEVASVHQRVGGVGRTADRIAGQMLQIASSLTVIQEHLLQQGGGKR